jgi:hypothetical protein
MRWNVLPSDDPKDWGDDAAVEDELRRLPSAKVPIGLEATLIAAIPKDFRCAETRVPGLATQHRLATWASVAAAILVLAAIVAPRGNRDVAGGPAHPGDSKLLMQATPELVVTKETDPCNILPPIPDWR